MGIKSSKDKKISTSNAVQDEKVFTTARSNKNKMMNIIEYESPYNIIETIPDMVNMNIKHVIMNFLYKKAESVVDITTPQNLANWLYISKESDRKRVPSHIYSAILSHYKHLSQINDPSRKTKSIKLKVRGTITKPRAGGRLVYYLFINNDIVCNNLVKLNEEMLRINPQHKLFFRKGKRNSGFRWISVNNGEIVPKDMYNKEHTYMLLLQDPMDDRLNFKIMEYIKEKPV